MVHYEMERDTQETEWHTLEENWRLERDAAKEAKTCTPKKPQMPPMPKKPVKPRPGKVINKPNEERNTDGILDEVDEVSEANESESEREAVIERMRQLEIEQFTHVRGFLYTPNTRMY